MTITMQMHVTIMVPMMAMMMAMMALFTIAIIPATTVIPRSSSMVARAAPMPMRDDRSGIWSSLGGTPCDVDSWIIIDNATYPNGYRITCNNETWPRLNKDVMMINWQFTNIDSDDTIDITVGNTLLGCDNVTYPLPSSTTILQSFICRLLRHDDMVMVVCMYDE